MFGNQLSNDCRHPLEAFSAPGRGFASVRPCELIAWAKSLRLVANTCQWTMAAGTPVRARPPQP